MTDKQINDAFMNHLLDTEARRDKNGNLMVYQLPAGDGGGTFEVAGINDRYHGPMARKLRKMIEEGLYLAAERTARQYLLDYTHAVDEWHPDERVEGLLRCIAFNRGAGGAAWILQYALRYGFSPSLYTGPRDRKVGPATLKAAAKADPERLIVALGHARTVYERTAIPGVKGARDEESQFWHGLFRRFVDDQMFALTLGE